MRKLTIAVLFAATSLVSVAHAAQDKDSKVTDTGYAVSVLGKPVARTWMSVDQFKPYSGVYAMADGKLLRVTYQQNRFYAQFDGEPAMQIYAVSSNEFIGKDKEITFQFDYQDGHYHEDLIVSTPATGRLVASR